MTTDRVGKVLLYVVCECAEHAGRLRTQEELNSDFYSIIERLGPLLRAGQAMRELHPNKPMVTSAIDWDAALATLEGRDGKFDDRKSNQSPWRPSRQTRGWMGARSQFDLGDD